MAINDASVLSVSGGKFYTAVYDADTPVALPADLRNPGVGFTEVGHTSLSDILSLSSEGGEATTLGTLQNRTLRTRYSNRTETFSFNLQQFDTAGLKLFYGSNATVGAAGEVRVPINPVPTIATFLVVFYDGDEEFGFYVPKAEIYRGDDMALGDTESIASLPIAVKPLQHSTNDWYFAVTPLGEAG